MPNEMIERCARALVRNAFLASPNNRADICQGFVDLNWRKHSANVRAVLHALREPTEAMVEAGAQHLFGSTDPDDWTTDVKKIWQAAINQALAED